MRVKEFLLLGITVAVLTVMGGCESNKVDVNVKKDVNSTMKAGNNFMEDETEQPGVPEENTNKDLNTNTQITTDIPMLALPEGITGIKGEASPNKELRDLIISYMEIPDDYLETTRYYYNYADLEDDGKNEIFVMVSGPYTSGTGGSSALLVSEQAGKLHIIQDFTLVNWPVILSDKITNGYHELIVPYFGGEKSQYSVLTYEEGEYTNVPDGKIIDTLEGITGMAIIANDILKEVEAGIMGFNLIEQ